MALMNQNPQPNSRPLRSGTRMSVRHRNLSHAVPHTVPVRTQTPAGSSGHPLFGGVVYQTPRINGFAVCVPSVGSCA